MSPPASASPRRPEDARGQRAMDRVVELLPLLVLFAMLLVLGLYALQVEQGGHGWKTGDWLISYEHGPIRRGLMGSLLFGLDRLGVPLLWAAFGVQALCYGALFVSVLVVYYAAPRPAAWLVFLLSPAFLLFPFYDFQGGFRKEILGLAALALLAASFACRRAWAVAASGVAVCYAIACFSHEINGLAFPFFAYLLWLGHRNRFLGRRATLVAVAAYAFIAAAALAFSALFPGDEGSASAACQSLTARGLSDELCDGAISHLGKSSAYSFARYVPDLAVYLENYLLLALLALAPLSLLPKYPGALRILAVIGGIALLPLFVLAVDWGRWIHLYSSMLFIVVLAESARAHVSLRVLPLPFGLFYVLGWSLPHCCSGTLGLGLWDTIAQLLF